MIKGIFSCDRNWGIGKNGTLPWPKNKADLAWFKKMTDGKIVVMGNNTWLDPALPKPLPNRYNVVITNRTQPENHLANLIVKPINAISTILELNQNNRNDVYVIGGREVFNLLLPLIENFYVTRFHDQYDCDVKFDLTATGKYSCTGYTTFKDLLIEKWKRNSNETAW